MSRSKPEIRALAAAKRRAQPDPERLSREICQRLAALAEYAAASKLLFYAGRSFEVRTDAALVTAWRDGKQVAMPCCVGDELELFLVANSEELAPRTLGILEPRDEVRACKERKIELGATDLIVLPGLAFDAQGGRLGHGKGYYDRLLRRAPTETPVIGLAFECQIFPEIPMLGHDVFVDKVITEARVYQRVRAGVERQ